LSLIDHMPDSFVFLFGFFFFLGGGRLFGKT